MAREIAVQLIDRLLQIDAVEWSEVAQAIYRALGDTSPQVARRAMQLCAARQEKENIEALNNLITKELSFWRERSYAALALALHSSAYRVQPFTEESLALLQTPRGLRHPKELLAQASAGLALSQVALRTSDPKLVKLLDREIPIVLIESVGAGNRHYRDFSSVMPLAYTMLRRITGKNFPDEAPIWARWWRDNGHNFRARRELIEVEEGDLPSTVVDVRPPNGGKSDGIRLVIVGNVRPTYRHGQAFAIERTEMEMTIALLRDAKFFETPEADPSKLAEGEALVLMRVGDLVRTVAFGARNPGRNQILTHMMEVGREKRWQHFWDRDVYANWDLFFADMNRWFHEHKDEQERSTKLRDLIAGSLDDMLYVEQRVQAVLTLKDLPGGATSLSDAQLDALVKALGAEPGTNDFVVEAVNFLVPAGGRKAALKLVDVLTLQIGPDAQALLFHVCENLPPEEVVVLSEDKRWQARIAATKALEAIKPEISSKALRARLTDEVVLVRVAAAEALARRKDKKALPTLAALAQNSTRPAVRAAAAYAYGLIGDEEGLRGIEPLLFDDAEAEVRRRAVEGLRAGKAAGAAELILRVFESETDRTVRAAAAFAVVDLETPELVDTLVQRLEVTNVGSNARVALVNVLARFEDPRTTPVLQRVLRGDDINSRDAAALGLARRWDAVAVTQLIRMVQARRHARAAVQHLELLTSQGFETEDYDEIARNYSDWFKIKSTGSPAIWFRDSLIERGYETSVLNSFVEGSKKAAMPPIDFEAVPMLLRVLRDGDWYINRNASALLALKMGKDAPDTLEYYRSPKERENSIRIFNEWWSKEEKRLEAERRG
jgi:HEAT repeat protein